MFRLWVFQKQSNNCTCLFLIRKLELKKQSIIYAFWKNNNGKVDGKTAKACIRSANTGKKTGIYSKSYRSILPNGFKELKPLLLRILRIYLLTHGYITRDHSGLACKIGKVNATWRSKEGSRRTKVANLIIDFNIHIIPQNSFLIMVTNPIQSMSSINIFNQYIGWFVANDKIWKYRFLIKNKIEK